MQLELFYSQGYATVPFRQPIKLISYGAIYFVIITLNNEIFCFDRNNLDFFEIINPCPETPIQHLNCLRNAIIIINSLNEIYTREIYGYNTKFEYPFQKINNYLKEKIKFVKNGEGYLIILTNNNSIYGYGTNVQGQLGIKKNQLFFNEITEINFKNVEDLQCGINHTLLLDIFGNIFTTGNNFYGQLGLNDTEDKKEFTKVELPFKVIQIHADNHFSFIINEFNELFGAGYNKEGQLGLGSTSTVKIFTKVVINEFKINRFWVSYNECSFVSDENNVYISGGKSCDVHQYFNISSQISDYENTKIITKFTKINCFEKKEKYIQVLPLEEMTVILSSNYKINYQEENEVGLKYLKSLQRNQLVDINIVCNEIFIND